MPIRSDESGLNAEQAHKAIARIVQARHARGDGELFGTRLVHSGSLILGSPTHLCRQEAAHVTQMPTAASTHPRH